MANPDHANKDWNYIKHIFMHHCHVSSPKILIETAVEAALPTLMEMSEYTCNDIATMRGGVGWGAFGKLQRAGKNYPKRSGSRRLGKCGRTHSGPWNKAIPPQQINDFMFMYEMSGTAFARSTLYKFFLFEVGKKFIINWMSLAYAAERCDLPWKGKIYTGWDALFTPGPDRTITCTIGPGSTECAAAGGSTIHVPAGCQVSISWLGEWIPFRNDPSLLGNVTMWLEDDQGVIHSSTTPKEPFRNNTVLQGGGSYNLPGAFPSGTDYRLKATIHSGLMGPKDGTQSLTIGTGGRPVQILPMQGCLKSGKKKIENFWGWLNSKDGLDAAGNKIPNPWWHQSNEQQYGPDQDGVKSDTLP